VTADRLFLDEARPDDVDALAAVERRCSPHPWTPRHFEAGLDPARRTRILVLRAAESGADAPRVVAFCAIRLVADEVHVENLAVLAELRRRGLGRLLLATALGAALRSGARVALLEVRAGNTGAQRLYAAAGFREAGRRSGYYCEPPEDALVLQRLL
jgi:ribosomal-protein-alanine N-acetyltransferase